MGTLFIVATPIGNLEDISARALRVLGAVSLIAAEDTRRTRQLLTHFDLHVPLTSLHEHNEARKVEVVLQALADGDVALVSDAGTPGISDPGQALVSAVLAAGYSVIPIPGPAAVIAALVGSGLPSETFYFLGFLARKASERRAQLEAVASLPTTLIAYESPHRLRDALSDILTVLGDRPMAVARELTKVHEEFVRGPVSEVGAHFGRHEPLGEITLVIAGASPAAAVRWDQEQVETALRERLAAGLRLKDAARQVADASGWTARDVYALGQR
jgi:16S rRNA (cytidine1402-2'-O)-methyltransferase